MNQNRQPKGTDAGGQFAPDINPESTLVLDGGAATTPRDELARVKSDSELEEFAEDANSNFDNWLANKAYEGDDWNDWTMADALAFMETFEGMIHARTMALRDDVMRADLKKSAAAAATVN